MHDGLTRRFRRAFIADGFLTSPNEITMPVTLYYRAYQVFRSNKIALLRHLIDADVEPTFLISSFTYFRLIGHIDDALRRGAAMPMSRAFHYMIIPSPTEISYAK